MEEFTSFELVKIGALVENKIFKLETDIDYYNLRLSRHNDDLYAKQWLADCTRDLEYYKSIKCKLGYMLKEN